MLVLCWPWSPQSRSLQELPLPLYNKPSSSIAMVDRRSGSSVKDSPVQTPSESTESDATLSDSEHTKPASNQAAQPQRQTHESRSLIPNFLRGPEDFKDGRFKGLTYEKVSSYPLGYPKWAAYQNSDPTFRVYKRFGTLRNRLLLHRQHELAKLEEDLNILDENDAKENDTKGRIRSIKKDIGDSTSRRSELMDTIDVKLKRYDELLERELRSSTMQTPTKRQFRSLVHFLWNRKPVVQSETKFLKHRDDFVLLNDQTESPLENLLDRIICSIPIASFRRLFSSEAQVNKFDKTTDRHTTLVSTEKIKNLARGIASLLAIFVIGVPLYVLASQDICDRTKIIVLLVALGLFPFAISMAARPKNHELFSATAAYCAVLSTFLATTNSFNSGKGSLGGFSNSTRVL